MKCSQIINKFSGRIITVHDNIIQGVIKGEFYLPVVEGNDFVNFIPLSHAIKMYRFPFGCNFIEWLQGYSPELYNQFEFYADHGNK